MEQISANQWMNWQNYLKQNIDKNVALDPQNVLIGFVENSGRISYSGKESQNKKVLQKEFNQLDYLIPFLTDRTYVEKLPSLASVLPGANKKYLIVHPNENNEEDIDALEELFDSINEINEPKYGICILDSESVYMSHGIAFIVWKDDETFHLAFYDPLSYRRKKSRPNGETYFMEYDYAKNVFEWIQEEIDENVSFEIHDLSKYCMQRLNPDNEFDCVQYHINAEYCYFYSLYFLYVWSENQCPLNENGFRISIEKSYIVPMEKINRGYHLETMTFKIILFSFILSILSRYFYKLTSKQRKYLPQINLYQEHLNIIQSAWIEIYGFPLILN
jgi:hypothetical protein